MTTTTPVRSRAWELAAAVPDPQLPAMTLGELGILRDVTEDDQARVHVQIAPAHAGWPATEAICEELTDALTRAGYLRVDVELVSTPAWSTDWMSAAARVKLAAYGLAGRGTVPRPR